MQKRRLLPFKTSVSILVLMDFALKPMLGVGGAAATGVSILVLMDFALKRS